MTYAISPEGLALIQRHEGFRSEPAQLPSGAWVVGYSHVRAGDPGAPLSAAEAADLLIMDVAPSERLVNEQVTQPLTQSQFDALVSFAFSVGDDAFKQSQVLRRVNAGEFLAAACAMDAWRKCDVGGEIEVLDALVRRRADEKAWFLKDMSFEVAPSVFLRAKIDHAAAILGAPVKYVSAPAVGSIAVAPPQPAPAERITEILMSEPHTEALLLTQVVADACVEEEIVTAHAKPVSRTLDQVRVATNRKAWFRPIRLGDIFENAGLLALLGFGFALVALGGSLLFSGASAIELMAGGAVAAPGLAALLMAILGFRRVQPVRA